MFDIEDCKVTFLTEDTYKVSFPVGRMLLRYETEPPHGDEVCPLLARACSSCPSKKSL